MIVIPLKTKINVSEDTNIPKFNKNQEVSIVSSAYIRNAYHKPTTFFPPLAALKADS